MKGEFAFNTPSRNNTRTAMKAQTLSPKITCSNPHPPFTSMMQHTFLSPPGTLHHSNHTTAAILLQSQATWARNGHCKDFASRFPPEKCQIQTAPHFCLTLQCILQGKQSCCHLREWLHLNWSHFWWAICTESYFGFLLNPNFFPLVPSWNKIKTKHRPRQQLQQQDDPHSSSSSSTVSAH